MTTSENYQMSHSHCMLTA